MNDVSDHQLLHEYIERRSEAAFGEVVRRHIDFVYSAALRMVRDQHLAEDITQSTFVALAQNAAKLTAHPVLSGWLHCTARNLAVKCVRADVRRRERELEAAAMNQLLSSGPDPLWEQIAPHLDAALSELPASDRDALLMRYFEHKSAREMGRIFGTSEEAAQKRVTRAVERLRELFARRGLAVGAGGLVVVISANAVHAAPLALPASIYAAAVAGTSLQTSTALATKAIAMTTLQKTLVTLTIVTLAGASLYKARQTSELSDQIRTLQQLQAPLMAQNQQLQHDRDDAVSRLAAMTPENQSSSSSNVNELLKLRAEVGQLREANSQLSSRTNDSREALVKSWLERRDKLKQLVEAYPDKSIPEFQMLSEEQWLNAAMSAKFDTEKNMLEDLADLRRTAENNVASAMHEAVSKYAKANEGQFPTDLSQLQPYFKSPLDEAILDRWQIQPQSALPNQRMGGDWIITEKSPVDSALDNRWAIGINGYGNTSYRSAELSSAIAILNPALKAYAAANNGKEPTEPSQILPYLTTPEQQAAYQKFIQTHDAPP